MKIRIDAITIGERRRQDLGDVQDLARSIDHYGLLHPVVIDADGVLVAGGRRLLACAALGWVEVEARSLGELSESERREIELEENLRRKDLTDYERSRSLNELAVTAASVLKEEADLRPESGQNPSHRPKEAGSLRDVSVRIGRPRSTIAEAQTHVETADDYPFMQAWNQRQVLQARDALATLPEADRPQAAALIDQPAIPPKDAIAIVKNLSGKSPEERGQIFALAESDDSRDRSAALTEAAAMPPMPDPRLALLDDAGRALRKAVKMFPKDPANSAITDVLDGLKMAYQAVKAGRG